MPRYVLLSSLLVHACTEQTHRGSCAFASIHRQLPQPTEHTHTHTHTHIHTHTHTHMKRDVETQVLQEAKRSKPESDDSM